MSHFLISYAGNKRNEYKCFKDFIDYTDINNIIEPFCGSSAISFNIWLEHKDKFNFYFNDNSNDIYQLYQLIKNDEPGNIVKKLMILKMVSIQKRIILIFLNLNMMHMNYCIKQTISN